MKNSKIKNQNLESENMNQNLESENINQKSKAKNQKIKKSRILTNRLKAQNTNKSNTKSESLIDVWHFRFRKLT